MAPNLRIAGLDQAPDEDERDLLADYIYARRSFDQAERHLKTVQGELAADMAAKKRKTYSMTDLNEGMVYGVTFVQAERYEINEKGLRRALTAKVYDKYTEKKLNRKALEEAMSRGEVDPMKVSKYVEVTKGQPYLRYSEKEAVEE